MTTHEHLEHWLLGLPLEVSGDGSDPYTKMIITAKKLHGCKVTNLKVPLFRMGTLDNLMVSTDELSSLYDKAQSLITKLIEVTGKVLEKDKSSLAEELLIDGKHPMEYFRTFHWDIGKYPLHLNVTNLGQQVDRTLTQTASDMSKMSSAYFEAVGELREFRSGHDCPLPTRDVSFLVKREDFVLGSKYLMTAVVVVPRSRYMEWSNCYERIDREVVPRSSALIYEDDDYGLFTVTLFKRHFQLFKSRAKELRFVVKDFVYDELEIDKLRLKYGRLQLKKKMLYGPLVKWLRANFSETYKALIHVQVLRMAVECVLRYGLPASFFAVAVTFSKNDTEKLLDYLKHEFLYVDESLKRITDKFHLEKDKDVPFVYFSVPAGSFFFK